MLSKKMKYFSIILVVLVSFVFFAQAGPKGEIRGHVLDSDSDSPINGSVQVFIENAQIGAGSDLAGNYNVANIPSGKYDITFSVFGYESRTIEDVRINMAVTTLLDVKLEKITGQRADFSAVTE